MLDVWLEPEGVTNGILSSHPENSVSGWTEDGSVTAVATTDTTRWSCKSYPTHEHLRSPNDEESKSLEPIDPETTVTTTLVCVNIT